MEGQSQTLVNTLRNKKSYVGFRPNMLPKGLSASRIVAALEFLSPFVIILHGSAVSNKRFSAAFWPLEQLYERTDENLRSEVTGVDLSIVTHNGLLSIIDGGSSLSTSLDHGFSILYHEGEM
jgi:hypothetical protein